MRFFVGFPPGGTNDIIARLLAQKLTEQSGVTYVVENRPGANTAIASEVFVRSAPDGYTIMQVAPGHATNPASSSSFKRTTYSTDRSGSGATRVLTCTGSLGLNRALISDIHGNLEGLQAVLADIREQRITQVYCLGDIIGYGPNPRECIDLARVVSDELTLGRIVQRSAQKIEVFLRADLGFSRQEGRQLSLNFGHVF